MSNIRNPKRKIDHYPRGFRGIVNGLEKRVETRGAADTIRLKHIWHFRVESYENGVLKNMVPVEMIGSGFKGWINEGDEVEVDNWKKGELMRIDHLWNHTNGIAVHTVKKVSTARMNWVIFIIVIIVVAVLLMARMG